MKRFLLFITILFLNYTISVSQPYFQRNDSIEVKINSSFIKNPWAGGLNFIQPSAIDLNMDGIKDLFTFDRTGNKVRTFINGGTSNTVDYTYDGSYESKFPSMHDWAILFDYNGDGKEDIFTYSKISAGFDVYKNISTVADGLRFQLVKVQQKSIFNPSRFSTTNAVTIPDGSVSSSWDGVSGVGNFATKAINISNLITTDWHLTSVCLNINHPNDDDLIVYLVNPCGNKIRLIKNAGGSGDNFTNTCFEPGATNTLGSAGNNTSPFSGTYAPEAGQAAWSSFLSCANPNGIWSLNVGDQTGGNIGTLNDWGISFYSPSTVAPNGLINLYVSSSDIPALSDIDNDGDLDVVTFSSLGTYMEYHQNMSKEFYGNADSLVFMVKNRCWGYAAEDASTNDYTLHVPCPGNVSDAGIIEHPNTEESRNDRHAGSCQLCIDLDADGDKEFIVGDISFSNLTMLTNGGTPFSSNMISVDTHFPENNAATTPLNLSLFPCAYYFDVNNDHLKDLLVCPNAPNVSENNKSVVLYDNTGTDNFPVFQFAQSDLLQNTMIDVGEGAYPVFFDYDNDGLKDLFIGNYGYYTPSVYSCQIAQFRNTGTSTNPQFELITRDYNNLSSLGIANMVPAFGDMDGDGDQDMIIGDANGYLNYFQNIASGGGIANFVLTQPKLKNSNNRSIDVGNYAAPQIVDVDNDGKNDLVVGGANGKFAYYHHSGTGTSTLPAMDSVSNFWGGIKVNQPGFFTGYSYPFLFKQAGVTKLLSGSQLGYLRLYDHIDGNLSGAFTLVDSMYLNIREGERSAPFGYDINSDGYLDLLVGNYQGGVAFYKGVRSLSINDHPDLNHWNFEIFPNPANSNFTVQISKDINSTYQIELFDLLGQKISQQKTSGNVAVLNTELFKSGIYICKVSEINSSGIKTNTLSRKIIIQH
jgi:subtilisin-like proprotein convertase family protein